MLTLLKTQTVFVDGIEYVVISSSASDGALLENRKTGERTTFDSFKLVTKYLTGTFLTASQHKAALKSTERQSAKPARMDGLSEVARKETHRRLDYLVKLDSMGAFDGSRMQLRKAIAFVAQGRAEPYPPHNSTIYRWKRKYLRAQRDVRALFARFDERGGKGKSRLDPAVELLLDEAVDAIALKQRRFSGDDLLAHLRSAIQRANAKRDATSQLKVPSLRTVQRRAAMLAEYDLTAAAFSLREADRRFPLLGNSRAVDRILELVEIDHTPIDIIVTNEARDAIGRPTATVVLDRRSRCVLGYHLSLAGHGVPSVFEALRHALMPKAYLRDGPYADLKLEWPCFGWMERLLMDNGREFHAEAVVDALLNLGIGCEFAGSGDPNDKPFIERFLRTLNYGFIHKLPGTTLDKIHKRVGFQAEDDAVLTLGELDRLIHVWICNIYHLRPHRGLGWRAPLAVWNDSARVHPPQLKMNAADVEIEFSEVHESRLQKYGIDLNTFVYRSERLLTMGRMLPSKSKVNVKWPRHDVGYIWVWDVTAQEYFRVDNKEPEYSGLTLDQAKAVRASKSKNDPDNTGAMADAAAVIRDKLEEAAQSKKLADRRKGGKLANQTSKDHRETAASSASATPKVPDDDVPDVRSFAFSPDDLDHIEIDLPAVAKEV